MTNKLLLPCIFILLQACSPHPDGADIKTAGSEGLSAASHPPVPLAVAVENLTYTGINDTTVTLTDGRWEGYSPVTDGGSPSAVGLIEDFMLAGDLDGDGFDELVVFLRDNPDGSAGRVYIAVAGLRNGDNRILGTALVGDRVQLRSGAVIAGKIELDVIQQAPGDAACCPTQLTRRFWILDTDGLKESQAGIIGTLSVQSLAGEEWILTRLERDKPLSAGPGITLFFHGRRLSGNSACNSYFASAKEGDMPGDLTVSRIGSTRMACPPTDMEAESRYLSALGGVTGYSFQHGKLALSWQRDGDINTMLFSPRASHAAIR